MEANYRLDVRGKACPMPVISVRNKLKEMKKGEVLEVITDFPASKDNIKRAATRAGHEVLNTEEENGSFRVYIRKK
ncbi:MAG: sulfurtransferase TusA family protein [Candidatus Freyarchaeota archaeon]|nr:sulfurtransferase TusA family protein [Candidatus Freyarchaeota archaeon]